MEHANLPKVSLNVKLKVDTGFGIIGLRLIRYHEHKLT